MVWEMTIVIRDLGFGCDCAMRDLAIRVSGRIEGLTVKGCGRGSVVEE